MKKVTEQDVERILSRYIEVDDDLIRKVSQADDVDDIRKAFFDSVMKGVDVSFALMYDWVIESMANQILKASGKKKKEKDRSAIENERLQKLASGKIRVSKDKKTKKEDIMVKRAKRLNLSREDIIERYNKSFEGKTREDILRELE